jgi:uncharacterized tellurite resistance protein B-like protein
MYLTFAHESDGDLGDDERSVIRTKLLEWCSKEATLDQASEYIDQTIEWYNTTTSDERIDEMVDTAAALKGADYSVDQRKAVLSDLIAIAKADGNYDEVEKKWVNILSEVMEVEIQS